METSFFVGANFTDAQGNWLAKPNAALYISGSGKRAIDDFIIILTLIQPLYNDSNGALTYKVSLLASNSNTELS